MGVGRVVSSLILEQIKHVKKTTSHYRMNICLEHMHILSTSRYISYKTNNGTIVWDSHTGGGKSEQKNGASIISVAFVSPQRIYSDNDILIHTYTH